MLKNQVCGPYPAPHESKAQLKEEKRVISQSSNHSLWQKDNSYNHITGCHPASSLLSQVEGPAEKQETSAAHVVLPQPSIVHSPLFPLWKLT